jgi:aminodeoxyfutalosine deaminase
MDYKYYAGDFIYLNNRFVKDMVVVSDTFGKIDNILPISEVDKSKIINVNGAIIPGFVNTHCHLELSHMKGKVDTGTSLLPFLKNVVSFRDIDQDVINQAIIDADIEMHNNGIVAVGDISNKADTAMVKSKSKIAYYTFVENFDFLQDNMAGSIFEQYKEVFDKQSDIGYNKKSMVPHAPYTVSKSLFQKINDFNPDQCTVSVHNQETEEENKLFSEKTGQFVDFYKGFGFPLDEFKSLGQSAIHYLLQNMNPKNRIIMVHNTTTKREDIIAAQQWNPKIYWATCPNANLYIENRLPDYQAFLDTEAIVTIGTDSLTSNWQLSILEEIKTIQKYCSYVPLELCIQWGTINGAESLGYSDQLGSIEIGKQPGLLCIDISISNNRFVLNSTEVKRLA